MTRTGAGVNASLVAIVALVALAPTALADAPGPRDAERVAAVSPTVCCVPGNRLSVEGGLAFLAGPDGPLGEPTGAPDSIFVDGLSYDALAVGRLTLETAPFAGGRFRLRGSWLGAADDEISVRGEFLYRPPDVVVPTSDVRLRAEATAWSADLEWMRPLWRRGRWAIDGRLGVGAIGFDETLEAVVGNLATVRGDAESLFLLARLGATAEVALAHRLSASVGAVGLVGLSRRQMTVEDSGLVAPGARRNEDRADSFAFGAEAGVRLTWRASSSVSLFAAYDVIVVTEVLRARDGLDFTRADTGAVQPRQRLDELTLQTVTVGLTLRL